MNPTLTEAANVTAALVQLVDQTAIVGVGDALLVRTDDEGIGTAGEEIDALFERGMAAADPGMDIVRRRIRILGKQLEEFDIASGDARDLGLADPAFDRLSVPP